MKSSSRVAVDSTDVCRDNNVATEILRRPNRRLFSSNPFSSPLTSSSSKSSSVSLKFRRWDIVDGSTVTLRRGDKCRPDFLSTPSFSSLSSLLSLSPSLVLDRSFVVDEPSRITKNKDFEIEELVGWQK